MSAENVAAAIYVHGWGSLGDSEVSALESEDFRALVDSFLEKYRRAQLVNGGTAKDAVSDPFSVDLVASVQWERANVARGARLWSDRSRQNYVLEVKEWSIGAFRNARDVGAHQMITQKRIDRATLVASGEGILSELGCPAERLSAFCSKLP